MSKKILKQKLDEGLLTSEFTMGFELEAYISSRSSYYNIIESLIDNYSYDPDDYDSVDNARFLAITDNITDILKSNGVEGISGSPGTHPDGSLDGGENIAFEYSSPIIPCTPKNFSAIEKTLTQLFAEGVYTDSSCGFHHHFHFKGMTERDMVWFYCSLAMDDDIRDKMEEFNGYELSNDDYASWGEIDNLRKYINNGDYKNILMVLNTDKWRTLRIHPQGTLEWRGPRGFLDEGTEHVKEFYRLVYDVIKSIRKYMDMDTLYGTNISKKEFFDNLKRKTAGIESKNTTEFLHPEYGSDNLGYKSNIRKPTETSLERIRQSISNNPILFYKISISKPDIIAMLITYMRNVGYHEFSRIFTETIEYVRNKKLDVSDYLTMLLNAGDSPKYKKMIINMFIYRGLYKDMTHEIKTQLYDAIDNFGDVYEIIQSVMESRTIVPLSFLETIIERGITTSRRTFFDIVNIVLDVIKKVTDTAKAKLIYFILSCCMKNNLVSISTPDNLTTSIKTIISNASMIDKWNALVKRGLYKTSSVFALYVGDKDVNTLVELISINHNVINMLSKEDKELLEKQDIYV